VNPGVSGSAAGASGADTGLCERLMRVPTLATRNPIAQSRSHGWQGQSAIFGQIAFEDATRAPRTVFQG